LKYRVSLWVAVFNVRKRFVEGFRELRSNGKPNFSNRVYRVESDLERIATRPVVTGTPTMPFIEAVKRMYAQGVRNLVITEGSSNRYLGMFLVEHMLSYLGGGELYSLVVNRYQSDFHRSLNTPVGELLDRNYPTISSSARLTELLALMIDRGLNIVPVVTKENTIYGVVSEHDIVRLLAEKHTGLLARDIMSRHIITVDTGAPLIEAIEVMVRTGLRVVFLRNEAGQIVGVLNAGAIVRFFGSNEAFRYVNKGFLEEALSVESRHVGVFKIHSVNPSDDIGVVAAKMLDENLGAVLVEDEGKYTGMIVKRDVFYALALPS